MCWRRYFLSRQNTGTRFISIIMRSTLPRRLATSSGRTSIRYTHFWRAPEKYSGKSWEVIHMKDRQREMREIKEAFADIHAEEELKNATKTYLSEKMKEMARQEEQSSA